MEAARTFGHLLVQHGPDAARLQLALTDPLIADDDTIVWLPCDLRCDRFEALRDSIIEAAGSNAVARGHLVQIEQVTLARANAARRYADAGTTEPAAAA